MQFWQKMRFLNASKFRLDRERLKSYQPKQNNFIFNKDFFFFLNICTFSMDNQCDLALEKLFKGISLYSAFFVVLFKYL